MYVIENPVLQRELLVNLRMVRGFVLLLFYVGLLGAVAYFAWPADERLDLTRNTEAATRLVNMFFLGQFVLLALMTPSFAAGAMSGEKERKTYEMLLASPLRPGAIVIGKLLASLTHLAVLVFCSLPIVMLCLLTSGVSPYVVLATYIAMGATVTLFGMISLSLGSYFSRSVAAEVVSYLVILPLALIGILFYRGIQTTDDWVKLWILAGFVPAACLVFCFSLMHAVSRRLTYPPDVGSQGADVIDLEEEQREAVGMVIRSDRFPDKLFAPPKRNDFMAESLNPVYDKEMRSEIFGHGSLMLRLVIQLSVLLELFVMTVCLFIFPHHAPWYAGYVLLFNLLISPVFAAGAVTNERERQTLELLLTTTLSPWHILSGKLASSLRVSVVLTSFLVFPLLLAWGLPPWMYVSDSVTMIGYLLIIGMTCLTTTIVAMFCSVVLRRTTVSLTTSYLILITLFLAPIAVKLFADLFFPGSPSTLALRRFLFVSPFAAAFSLPLDLGDMADVVHSARSWWPWTAPAFLAFYGSLNLALTATMIGLFNRRWRVAL